MPPCPTFNNAGNKPKSTGAKDTPLQEGLANASKATCKTGTTVGDAPPSLVEKKNVYDAVVHQEEGTSEKHEH